MTPCCANSNQTLRMYSDATIVDDQFPAAAVYYSEQHDTYIYGAERNLDNYYDAGNGYPLAEQNLLSVTEAYPVSEVVIYETDNNRLLVFDIDQYLTAPALPTDQRHPVYRYVPIEDADLSITITKPHTDQNT